MKAHISNYRSFTPDEYAILDGAFDLFLETSEIEGVSKARKKENDLLALSVKNKLAKNETHYNAEEMRIMSVVLLNMQIYISNTKSFEVDNEFKTQREKYLRIIKELLDFFDLQFSLAGIKTD